MDLTYFIDYQSKITLRAIKLFLETYKKIIRDKEDFDRWLWDSGLYKELSDKQRILFNIAKEENNQFFTTREVEANLGCSYNTAANALNGLVTLGLFSKKKNKREWLYYLIDRQDLQKNWKSLGYP